MVKQYTLLGADSDTGALQALYSNLLASSVIVGCPKMLGKAAVMRTQFGLEDIKTLNEQGFAFDNSSLLWITHPEVVLNHVSEGQHAQTLCELLQNEIAGNFESFAESYLEETSYVMAFWPLNEESMRLASDANSPISRWIVYLDKWIKRKIQKGLRHPIDRFFIVPSGRGIIENNRYKLAGESPQAISDYVGQVRDFFHHSFKIEQCCYRKNVFVIFETEDVCRALIDRTKMKLLRENTVLFSKKEFDKIEEDLTGVLQFQDTIDLKNAPPRKIMQFRYLKLQDVGSSMSNRTRQSINEIKRIRKALAGRRPRVKLIENCPAIISIDRFLSEVVGS